ncbi:MAG TPA: DCC1-like thiol-disulfide oxidoreductase family protein [Hyphomicrobiaceae bacterium]|jgi:predicted DCC family thiol-disulfide oxidoreductase YuxK
MHEPTNAGGESSGPPDYLLYDGECPACSAYVAMSRLRQLYPRLRVLDARAEPGLVADLRRRGYEINVGMVLCLGGTIHFGADATRLIALLGKASPSRWRRAALAAIGSAPWSARLYPWLNRARGVLLRLLRRTPIA